MDSRLWIQDYGFKIMDSRLWIQDYGFKIMDSRLWIQDYEFQRLCLYTQRFIIIRHP